jgi:hypothetical protein
MAVKVVHVSDVSDKEGSQEELGTLEVLEHPEIGEPARLKSSPTSLNGSRPLTRSCACAGPRRAPASRKS